MSLPCSSRTSLENEAFVKARIFPYTIYKLRLTIWKFSLDRCRFVQLDAYAKCCIDITILRFKGWNSKWGHLNQVPSENWQCFTDSWSSIKLTPDGSHCNSVVFVGTQLTTPLYWILVYCIVILCILFFSSPRCAYILTCMFHCLLLSVLYVLYCD